MKTGNNFVHNLRLALIELGIAVIVLVLFTCISILPRRANKISNSAGSTNTSEKSDFLKREFPINYANDDMPYGNAEERLAAISRIVQLQLFQLQNNSALCNGPTLLCGHQYGCGLGCQIHHRMTCVALSYALQIPLIHEDTIGWPYNKPWKSAFAGPGSSCQPKSETIQIRWGFGRSGPPRLNRSSSKELKWGNYITTSQELPFPLQNGFVVPQGIGSVVEEIHENPFLWWAGQFAKFTMTLTQEQTKIVEKAKQSIGVDQWSHPTVGIHVRKTDKVYEDSESIHQISEYISATQSLLDMYFNHSDQNTKSKTIFIASDDSTVLYTAKRSYPGMNITGFPAKETYRTQAQRSDSLDDIINDLAILSESDFNVCGFSSNICRLLLELLSTRYSDASRRLKAMDRSYIYQLYGMANIPNKVIFI